MLSEKKNNNNKKQDNLGQEATKEAVIVNEYVLELLCQVLGQNREELEDSLSRD